MSLLPLRRRSYLLKLLILIPAAWMFAVFVFAYFGEDKSYGQQQARNNDNRFVDDVKKDNRKHRRPPAVEKIEGFGPPINKGKLDESLGMNDEEKKPPNKKGDVNDDDDDAINIPKPQKFVIDPNNPIYKTDPKMPGELGKPVNIDKNKLAEKEKKKYDDGWTNNAFNEYASDMISVHRSLPVMTDKECDEIKYDIEKLPDTSVILCFHNEAWSVLLRSVHSILERSPSHLIHEVILVDDYSDKDFLKQPLEDYMRQFPKVKILRLEKREGLIRARLRGAAVAKGKVLTYLDSHIECEDGWLPPLLQRIYQNSSTVVCPVIDVIDDTTFEYHYSKAYYTNVGGFDWSLQFNWHPIPDRDRKKRKSHVDPVGSPTMAGGLFAIDKEYFEYLGSYDSGFDIWGGENLEISFKIWMCGGSLEIVPCSHVGHIFRKRSPYKWRTGVNVLKRNSVRLAEVWLDEYKTYYYERINNQLGDFGDISDRKSLRNRLKCKSFKWYLDNIYPELFVPGDAVASGEVRNQGRQAEMCFDSPTGDEQNNKPIAPYPCHGQGGNQYWMLSKDGEIRRDESCVDYAGQEVMIFPCHGMKGNQEWEYKHSIKQLLHVVSKKCLEMTKDGSRLEMNACNPDNKYQQWAFKTVNQQKSAAPKKVT